MPPSPPALARIASTSERARASTRRSVAAARLKSARKRAANSSSGGANGARNIGGLKATLFMVGSALTAHGLDAAEMQLGSQTGNRAPSFPPPAAERKAGESAPRSATTALLFQRSALRFVMS